MLIVEDQIKIKKQGEYTNYEFIEETVFSTASGLCATCIHQKVCGLSNSNSVIECDDFLSERVNKAKSTVIKMQETVDGDVNHESGVGYQGLCVNCENNHSCSSSAAMGGIWFCEEYC